MGRPNFADISAGNELALSDDEWLDPEDESTDDSVESDQPAVVSGYSGDEFALGVLGAILLGVGVGWFVRKWRAKQKGWDEHQGTKLGELGDGLNDL